MISLYTSNGVPESWLASYGWTNAFEQAENGDQDEDGELTWQEYVAGTNPTNAQSVLRLSLTQSAERMQLCWNAAANRYYSLLRRSDLNKRIGRINLRGVYAGGPGSDGTAEQHIKQFLLA